MKKMCIVFSIGTGFERPVPWWHQTEPERFLGRLCECLVRYLAMQRQNKRVDKKEEEEEFTLEKEIDSRLLRKHEIAMPRHTDLDMSNR